MSILNDVVSLDSRSTTRKGTFGKSGALTIVNSEKNGKRLILSKELEEYLQLTDSIQIAIGSNEPFILVANSDDIELPRYKATRLSKENKKSRLVIYNSSLVLEIASKLHLDFSDTVSVTFYETEYIEEDGNVFAKITL